MFLKEKLSTKQQYIPQQYIPFVHTKHVSCGEDGSSAGDTLGDHHESM